MKSASKTPSERPNIQWHSLKPEEVFEYWKSNPQKGLSHSECLNRRILHGWNRLTKKKKTPAFLRFLYQFHQPLVYILLAASALTFLLKEWVDSGVIFGVVFVNAVIGYVQEAKAIDSLEALSRTLSSSALTLRDGIETKIPSEELVPGDVVILASGDKVPADMRLFQTRELQINESALTGESLPVQKTASTVESTAPLADRKSMLYASALVTYGTGRAIVVATGNNTEVGRISELISQADDMATPLTNKMAEFSRLLLVVIIGLAVVTFCVGVLRGQPAVEMFMAAVALAVGAIPEGLPAAVTITLAIGVSRMSRRKAIVRKLSAVETLGSAMIICSDKTGTLTENQMTVQAVWAGFEHFDVTGSGYSAEGQILKNSEPAALGQKPALQECLRAGLLCNDSHLIDQDGQICVEGDPTEAALITAARKGGGDVSVAGERLDTIPFESQYQYMATLHQREGCGVIYMKGSIEKIIQCCSHAMDSSGQRMAFNANDVIQQAHREASEGLRVLAFASKSFAGKEITHKDVLSGMTFLGFQSMMDPPREEAKRAIENCHRAGIEVKMITGDHVLTALAIAKKLGIRRLESNALDDPRAVTGSELNVNHETAFAEMAQKTSVFARVTPEQKLNLVRALQALGNVVAMTGDGVNDAPALKQANIGVAMGLGGTEVAKEAADIVLTDDNFASIEAAVEEGRCVYFNLKKFIVWTLPTNLGEGLAILAAIFCGTALPVVPVQLLWINMTTSVCLGLMLAFEAKEPDTMHRPPRKPSQPILTRGLLIRTLYVGLMLVAGVFGLFLLELKLGSTLEQARTASAGMLVMGELFYLFNCRSLTQSAFKLGIFSNPKLLIGVGVMLLLQGLFTYLPVMNQLFHTAPLSVDAWIRILSVSTIIYIVVGVEKHFHNLKKSNLNSI